MRYPVIILISSSRLLSAIKGQYSSGMKVELVGCTVSFPLSFSRERITLDSIRDGYEFDVTCQGSVAEALSRRVRSFLDERLPGIPGAFEERYPPLRS